MATKNYRRQEPSFPWVKILLVVFVIGSGIFWYFGQQISGYSQAGTSYGAKNACSCRFLAGRDLGDCSDDFMPGMEFVFLSQDEETQSVTAYIPLIASQTATYSEAGGCVLESLNAAQEE